MFKVLAAVLFSALVLAGCKSGSSNKFKVCWAGSETLRFCYSKNISATTNEDGSRSFIMQGKAEPHYFVKKTSDISNAKEFVVRYKVEAIEGTPRLVATDCKEEKPGQIAAFFQRRGDDMYAKDNKQYYRWWSKNRPNIEEGEHELRVSLNAEDKAWTSVWGKDPSASPELFARAKKEVRQIGVTFGGCGGAGHGINVKDGKMKITILEVRAE